MPDKATMENQRGSFNREKHRLIPDLAEFYLTATGENLNFIREENRTELEKTGIPCGDAHLIVNTCYNLSLE